MKTSQFVKSTMAGLAVALISVASASASILYSYDFSGSGDMNGQTLNGQTWYGAGINANGSYSLANNGQGYQAFGWQLQSGYIYDFKVDINQTSGNWAGIGIATTFGLFNTVAAPNVAASYITTGQTWGGGIYQEGGASGSGTYRISVDTTAANWTTSFLKDGVQVGATRVWTGEAPFGPSGGTGGYALLGLVGYGNGVATAGTFSNLELSVVPEPSTYAMVLGGIATLLLIRRRVQA
jgi:hypothetical protein